MKKMLHSSLRWPCLLQGLLNRRFIQNKPALMARNITIISPFLSLGRKLVAAKIWWRRKCLKQK